MAAYVSPIPGLPSETVISILIHAINATIAEDENVPQFLASVCLVSKLWHHFIISARELWCNIDHQWPVEQRSRWLELSYPRAIDFRGTGDPSPYEDVIEHGERFRSVTLFKTPPKSMEYFLEDLERHESLSHLTSLVLECDIFGQGQAHYSFPDDFTQRAPRFHSLSIAILIIPNIDVVAARLTRLEIFSSTHSAETLMKTISQCKSLEYLALGGLFVHGPYELGRITMPTLRTLVLGKGNNADCVEVILGIGRFGPATAHLRAPWLKCFFLWYDGPCDVRFTNAVSAFVSIFPFPSEPWANRFGWIDDTCRPSKMVRPDRPHLSSIDPLPHSLLALFRTHCSSILTCRSFSSHSFVKALRYAL